MRRPGRAGTQAGSGRVAATATVAAARAADRPGLPEMVTNARLNCPFLGRDQH
jgi:hypothetical protein